MQEIKETNYNHAEMENLLTQYTPLVKALAAHYKGRGAEYDDLVQEGYLALLRLIPKCGDRQWLAAFLKNHLPGYVRNAAERQRRKENISGLDEDFDDFLPDERSREERGEFELDETLVRALTEAELDIARLLLDGRTQRELAEKLEVSQQAVGAKIRRIRNKLTPHLAADGRG